MPFDLLIDLLNLSVPVLFHMRKVSSIFISLTETATRKDQPIEPPNALTNTKKPYLSNWEG